MSATMTQLLPSMASLGTRRDLHPQPTAPFTKTLVPVKRSALLPSPPSRSPVSEVLEKDKETPDHHVARDPRMIRLTGTHPFNSEAPLTALYKEGFLTSVDLFYVRNHGAVPQVLDDEVWSWELSIEGLVENPFTISLREIVDEFEQITLPITLVCAGNRRKEQNTVRKSKGFSWGPAGLSTAEFTGTLLRNVLKRAKPMRGARYVCMEGADKLPNGYYGTSLKLNWCMDPDKGIMLAHGMNGAPLRPDHGRPLRVVVPGQIGGRSVKWLRRLIVTAEPSDNWYHYYDNRVLPTSVTPEMSADPAWWKDERYAIYDLNVNSAVVYPQHDEVLDTSKVTQEYTIKGYAYSGGGRRVTRVEISLDNGKSWRLADIQYPEDAYRKTTTTSAGLPHDMPDRDTSFCWCLWSHPAPILSLLNAPSILVRAMDEALAIQPRDMYWSVLGMMNNPWFRISIEKSERGLRFEHPTSLVPGQMGWMERVKNAGGDLLNGRWGEKGLGEGMGMGDGGVVTPPPEEVRMTREGEGRVWSMGEVREGVKEGKALFVVSGEVYDGTGYLEEHPGGAQSITAVAGKDTTEDFLAIHSENAKAMMRDYHVGRLDDEGRKALLAPEESPALSPTRPVFLDTQHWAKATLSAKKTLSWDTKLFTFNLDHEDQLAGLPVGQHLMLRLKDPATEENIIRAYTPVSETSQKGTMDLLVKLYLPTETSAGGRMTCALDQVPLNASVEFKGPVGRFEYLGRGNATIRGTQRKVTSFTMICGGSGITPIFQVFRAVMQDPEDETFCTVIDSNRLEEDILCRHEIEELQNGKGGEGCKVIHTLTKASDTWTGLRGRISEDLLREAATPAPGKVALVCGPEAMEKSVKKILLGIGWEESDLVFF